MATRLHARESIGAPCYIRLLSIIPYYLHLAAAISSFVRDTPSEREPLIYPFFFSLALLSPFIHDHPNFARSCPTPINFAKFRWIWVTPVDKAINYEREIISRSVCTRAHAPFFYAQSIRLIRTNNRIGRLQRTNNARYIELVNFDIIRSASVSFICEVTLLPASRSVYEDRMNSHRRENFWGNNSRYKKQLQNALLHYY